MTTNKQKQKQKQKERKQKHKSINNQIIKYIEY